MPDKEVKIDISETKLNLIRDFSSEESPNESSDSENNLDMNLSKKFDCLESSLLRSQNNVLLGIKELGKIVNNNKSSASKYSFIDRNNTVLEKNQSDVFDLNESVADNLDGIEKGIGELNKDLTEKLDEVGKKDNSSLLTDLIGLVRGGLILGKVGPAAAAYFGGLFLSTAALMADKEKTAEAFKNVGVGAIIGGILGMPLGLPGITVGAITGGALQKNLFNFNNQEPNGTSGSKMEEAVMDTENSNRDPNATWNNWGEGINFTTMTLNEVMAEQRNAKRTNPRTRLTNGKYSSAVGLGQFVEGTINSIVTDPSSGITSKDTFNGETQLKMIRYLIEKATSEKTDEEKIAALRGTWPGLQNKDDSELLKILSEKGGVTENNLPSIDPVEYNKYLFYGTYWSKERREKMEKQIRDIETYNANKAELLKQQEKETTNQEILQQQPQASVINAPSSTVNNTIIQKNIMPYIEDFDYMRMVAKTGSNNAFIG